MSAKWELVLALPNLELPHERFGEVGFWERGIAFDDEYFAIVSPADPRLGEIRSSDPGASRILESFRDETGKPYVPSAIIANRAAPYEVRTSAAAVIDFRNIVAMAALLRSRASVFASSRFDEPVFSETFDLHPAQVGRNGSVVIDSPGLLSSLGKSADLNFTGSPFVIRAAGKVIVDERLFRGLAAAWTKYYAEALRGDDRLTSLFRALQLAFGALAVPNKNMGSAHDFGVLMSLWVSALEILVLPAGKSSRDRVSKLVKRDPQFSVATGLPEMDARNARLVAFLGGLCDVLYSARNDFIHGNPLSQEVFVPQVQSVKVNLLEVAPVVFRSALAAFLAEVLPEAEISFEGAPDQAVSMLFADEHYRHALEHLHRAPASG
jgi:hypothetical protein